MLRKSVPPLIIGHIGRIVDIKNPFLALDAMRLLDTQAMEPGKNKAYSTMDSWWGAFRRVTQTSRSERTIFWGSKVFRPATRYGPIVFFARHRYSYLAQ